MLCLCSICYCLLLGLLVVVLLGAAVACVVRVVGAGLLSVSTSWIELLEL